MRIVILWGAIVIANVIGKGNMFLDEDSKALSFTAWIAVFAIIFDVAEFVKNMSQKG